MNQSNIYLQRREFDEVMKLNKEAEYIFRTLNDIVNLARCLNKQAAFLIWINQPYKALPLAEERPYRIATDHGMTALAQQIKPS